MTPYERLREFRISKGWSCQQLADMVGFSKTAIVLLENSRDRIPKLDLAVAIEKVTTEGGDPIRVEDWCSRASTPPKEAA